MKRYWFKAKTYGYGWYPATWEGWLILLGFIGFAVWNFFRIDALQHSGSDTLMNAVPEAVLIVAVLILVCYLTGEPARWNWPKK